MSFIADLHQAALNDPTVYACVVRFQNDPDLDEVTALTALVLTLVVEKQALAKQVSDYAQRYGTPVKPMALENPE